MKIVSILKEIKHRIHYYYVRYVKHAIHYYYVFYADSTELLEKAQEKLRPLPEGLRFVRLTYENKHLYKCTIDDMDKMLHFSVDGESWLVVDDDNNVVAFHYGAYRGNRSIFYNVRNCDFEHVSIQVDKKYQRQGIALHLLYHVVKNLKYDDVKNKKLGTCIKPSNIKSIKLHELIGFKISHRVILIHIRRKKDGHYTFINIPHYNI